MAVLELSTSSYTQFKPEWGVPVPITLGAPKMPLRWHVPPSQKTLAPDYSWFKASDEVFNSSMIAKLNKYGVDFYQDLFRHIAHEAGDNRLVLLCYEDLSKPSSVCHRELIAAWWEAQTGQKMPEKGFVHMPRPEASAAGIALAKGVDQMSMF